MTAEQAREIARHLTGLADVLDCQAGRKDWATVDVPDDIY